MLTWPAFVWWTVFFAYAALLIFNPMAILNPPKVAFGFGMYEIVVAPLLFAGYIASALFAVLAARRRRWGAVLMNMSTYAMLVVALLGLLE